MTVIRPNSVSGITSITAQANEINVFRSNGLLAGLNLNGVNFNTTAGISTFAALKVTGNLDVAGVLTYQDVTNVDSLGIGTFRTGINVSGGQLDVGSNIKLGNAGVITATSFSGSSVNLTNFRITSSGTAVFGGNATAPIVDNGELYYRGNSTSTFQNLPQNFYLYSDDKAYNATNPGAGMLFGGQYTSGGQYTTFAGIHGIKENNTDNNYNSALVFGTRQQGSNTWERLRITSTGIHKITTAGDTSDGTYYSTLTINNTGSSTWSRLRFDRSDVARWGIALGQDDKFRISNLYTNGSVGSPDDNCFVIDNTSKVTMSGFLEASGGAATGHGAKLGNLSVGYDNLYNTIQALANSTNLHLQYNVNGDIQCNEGGGDMVTADIRPRINNQMDLGTNSYRWRNIHTNDLNLSNEGNVNEVDGTWGQYTIQEGESDLFLINRRSGKRYKFLLQEVD